MENLIIALTGAAISGVTFIAYRHPNLFEKEFSPKINYISIAILLIAVFHDTGVTSAHNELLPLLKDGVAVEVQIALKNANFSEYVYYFSLGSLLYGMFLTWLADHMKKERN